MQAPFKTDTFFINILAFFFFEVQVYYTFTFRTFAIDPHLQNSLANRGR